MILLNNRWPRRQARDGTAVVETAIVFPLLLLMMFGIIQLGYFMYMRIMMMEACRRGCRAMVVVGKNTTAVDPANQYSGPYAANQYLQATFSQYDPNAAPPMFTITANPAPPTSDQTNQWYMIDRMTITTTIGQALQFKITGFTDPPITASYLMMHEGSPPVP